MECGHGSNLIETRVSDLDKEQWYWWNPTLQQYQPCEGMTEEQVSLAMFQDKTATVDTREEGGLSHLRCFIPTLINIKTIGH